MGLALFSLTLSAFVTSTVAWFSVSDFLRVENINLGFEGRDMQIGKKNENGEIVWGQEVRNDERTYLRPVSSMLQDNSVYDDDKLPTLSDGYPAVNPNPGWYWDYRDTIEATEGFFQMEVFFKSDTATFVHLDKETSIKAEESMNAIIANQVGTTTEQLNKVQDAIRVHFYSEDASVIYEPNVEESSKTKLAGPLDIDRWDGYFDFDTKTKKERLYGDYNWDAELIYDDPTTEDVEHPEYMNLGDGFKGKTKAGVKHINVEKSEQLSDLRIKEEKTYALKDLEPGGQEIVYLEPGIPKRVIVTIYLEGWDLDCVNSLISAAFYADIKFTGLQRPRD